MYLILIFITSNVRRGENMSQCTFMSPSGTGFNFRILSLKRGQIALVQWHYIRKHKQIVHVNISVDTTVRVLLPNKQYWLVRETYNFFLDNIWNRFNRNSVNVSRNNNPIKTEGVMKPLVRFWRTDSEPHLSETI